MYHPKFMSFAVSKSMSFALLLIAATIILTGCQQTLSPNSEEKMATTSSSIPSPAEKPVTSGQEIFLNNCVGCHQGAGNPPGPDATIVDSERLSTESSFEALLRKPTSAMMKNFSEQELDKASVHTLYQYLTSSRKPH
jgi:mono/diheme cytochrome c family protein